MRVLRQWGKMHSALAAAILHESEQACSALLHGRDTALASTADWMMPELLHASDLTICHESSVIVQSFRSHRHSKLPWLLG
jgi:hypothetical protein